MTSFEHFKHDFAGKRVLVMGLGIQGGGVGVAKFLIKAGAQVTVTDLRTEDQLKESLAALADLPISYTLGKHSEVDLEKADCIIKNPAIPADSLYIQRAQLHNLPIYMEAALFAKYTSSQIVGITGTRGKTTTTTMIFNLLKTYLPQTVALAGNIPGQSTLELLIEPPDIAVLELSSWQLQGFDALQTSPHIAVLTNIYPDHLNRYPSMVAYIEDKAVITKYQTADDYFIYNQDDEQCSRIAVGSKACKIGFSASQLDESIQLKLIGQHNRANAAAADQIGALYGISKLDRAQAFRDQEVIPFRLEKVAVKHDITYINDTTSTTPIALVTAVNALDQTGVYIVGGQSKSLPTDDLVKTINSHPKVKLVVLIPGSGTDEIEKRLDPTKIGGRVKTLEEAVELARQMADPGEAIVLSPAFTSFDQYRNEFERGRHFNRIVEAIQ